MRQNVFLFLMIPSFFGFTKVFVPDRQAASTLTCSQLVLVSVCKFLGQKVVTSVVQFSSFSRFLKNQTSMNQLNMFQIFEKLAKIGSRNNFKPSDSFCHFIEQKSKKSVLGI